MEVSLGQIERESLVRGIDRSRSVCLLVSWALDTLSDGGNLPASEGRRMELLEGASHVLGQSAQALGEIRRTLSD